MGDKVLCGPFAMSLSSLLFPPCHAISSKALVLGSIPSFLLVRLCSSQGLCTCCPFCLESSFQPMSGEDREKEKKEQINDYVNRLMQHVKEIREQNQTVAEPSDNKTKEKTAEKKKETVPGKEKGPEKGRRPAARQCWSCQWRKEKAPSRRTRTCRRQCRKP